MLALAVIAIAIAGTGIYLAIDTREGAVSEGDIQTLQQELEARIDSSSGGGAEAAALKSEVAALQTQVEKLESSGGKGKSGSGASGGEQEKAPESAKP